MLSAICFSNDAISDSGDKHLWKVKKKGLCYFDTIMKMWFYEGI